MQRSGQGTIEGFDAARRSYPPSVEAPRMLSQLAQGLSTQGVEKPPAVEGVEPGSRVEDARTRGKVIRNADRRRRVQRRVLAGPSEQHQQDISPERKTNPEQGAADPRSQSAGNEERVARFAGMVK